MRTEKEIEIKKQNDRAFIVSAVTSELHDMAYLDYFGAWENNGGMGWFFDECVEITDKVMFTEGSPYMRWLEHWKSTDNDRDVEGFSEFTGETCFDWYHMDEARKEFQSRYTKDYCNKQQVSEHIGGLIMSLESEKERDELIGMAIRYAEKQLKIKKDREEKLLKIEAIIKQLKDIDVDGQTMQHILEKVGMDEQMYEQLKYRYQK